MRLLRIHGYKTNSLTSSPSSTSSRCASFLLGLPLPMALSKACLAFLLLAFMAAGHLASTANAIDCAAACEVRCSKSWKPKMCHRACGTCCARCSCVPSGTSVYTRDECPCYAKMTTHGGRLKCP